MRSRRVLSLVALVPLALSASVGIGAAQQSEAAPAPRVHLQWSLEFPARQDPVGLSIAPHHSYVLVSPRHHGYGLHVTRYDHRGREMWDHGWIGSHGAVLSVQGEASAVSSRHDAVLIAGHATCRYQGDDPGALGPVFIRKYTLNGDRQWTRWIGSCPRRSSDREVRALSVSGLDISGRRAAVSFTEGNAFDCCEHHRKGQVALLGLNGSLKWRTTLDFPLSRVWEVVTSDVTVSQNSLTVSGAVMWDEHGADGFLVNLSRATGSVRWRRVASGATEANNDGYQDLDSVGPVLFATGTFDDAFEGGGARGTLERWSTSGERTWRVRIRPYAQVSALQDRSALWSVPVSRHNAHAIMLARQRPQGASAWRVHRDLPDGGFPVGYAFDATAHFAFGAADIVLDNRDFLQAWCWHLR